MATKRKRTIESAATTSSSMFIVSHGGYPYDVLVAIGATDAEVVAKLKSYDDCTPSDDDIAALTGADRAGMDAPATRLGCAILLDGNQTVLRLREWLATAKWHGHLAHEIFHAVTMLFEEIGMTLSGDSDEAYAYAVEGLTVSIYEQLALPPSKRNEA